MQAITTITCRREARRFALAALSAATAMVCSGAAAQAVTATATEFAPGRILLMPRAGLPDSALAKLLAEHGAGRSRRIGDAGLRIVELPAGLEKQLAERLARHPFIKFAEIDRVLAPDAPPNDPYYGSEWHLGKIGSSAAWDVSTGAGVTIAILDTGVDSSHPDLAARMVPGWNFYGNNADTSDAHGHGTAVAGAAAASLNNGEGVAAVAGQARILPVRIADANAYATYSTVAQGLTWAADQGARIANISYSGVITSQSVLSAAQYMKSKGGLVFTSAGNNNRDEGYAAAASLIPVSATDANDLKTSFSSWGGYVAMAAPGINIWTTQRGGSYGQWWGTSIAAPITAGVAALMMARNPALPASQVESLLYSTATDLGTVGRDPVFGNGRVNAQAAVQAAAGATSTQDTVAPSVAITSPTASSTVSGIVTVNPTASDNVGVTRVDLRVNGSTVASDTASPFAFAWDTTQLANGMASLVTVAYDAAGNTTASAGVPVNVANVVVADTTPPVVSLRNPAAGSTVSGNVSIQVAASDNGGAAGIRQTLFINDKQVATASGATLNYKWNTVKLAPGSYTIRAVAKDVAGNTSSQSITVRR